MIARAGAPWFLQLAVVASALLLCLGCSATFGTADAVAASTAADTADIGRTNDFGRYREAARVRLLERSMPSRGDSDIALNLPFERAADPAVAYRGRFLLFHGLNDSPGVWHDFADALVERGFDVRALLFDGHGSTPEEMLDVEWESWLGDARRWLAEWLSPTTTEEVVPVYLGGFSMGGVIATLLALEEPRVRGLLLISPAYRSSLDRWLRFAGLYARFRPWVFGGMIAEDNPIKYNSIPINSGWQFHRLTRALARRWRPRDRIDVPALLVVSAEDSVVDVSYTQRLFRRRFTDDSRLLIVYAPDVRRGAPPSIGPTFAEVAAEAHPYEEVRDSRHLELRALGQSHLSLTNAPSNPLFGRGGSVLVCNGNEYPIFMACMRARGHWYGAQHTPSPNGVPVARMTWNPDWEHVLRRLDETVLGR